MAMFVSTQFHKEARDTQDLLKRLEKELDQKYNPEFKDMYQMEGLIMEIDVSITRSEEQTSFKTFKITESSPFFCMFRTKPRLWSTLTIVSRLFRSGVCRFYLCITAERLP